MSKGEFRAAAVAILERIEGRMRQLAAELSHHMKAAELGNVLLQLLVSIWERGVAVRGEVLPEGDLEMESDAGDSEYKTDKSEEGTEEEEEGGEGGN